MITIKQHYIGFQMRFSAPGTGVRGYSVIAKDSGEVKNAIDHHIGTGHNYDLIETCPLCRMVVKERQAEAKRHARETKHR
jgi:hypothetical protein